MPKKSGWARLDRHAGHSGRAMIYNLVATKEDQRKEKKATSIPHSNTSPSVCSPLAVEQPVDRRQDEGEDTPKNMKGKTREASAGMKTIRLPQKSNLQAGRQAEEHEGRKDRRGERRDENGGENSVKLTIVEKSRYSLQRRGNQYTPTRTYCTHSTYTNVHECSTYMYVACVHITPHHL
jgi:hypothetical protein